MKINSKILSVLMALLAIMMIISAASAVDLVKGISNDDFGIDVVSGTNFNENVNINSNDVNLVIFENSGNNSKDVNSIIYFEDSTADKNEIVHFIKDLEDDGNKVEETDKYTVFKTAQTSNDFDAPLNLDTMFNFVTSLFSSDDGLNISAEGDSVSLSDKGLYVSTVNGENVSISSEGISVSDDSSFDNENIDVSGDIAENSEIENSDYFIFLKNSGNDKVIVIFGDNLEMLKSMAETATFNEN